jgi:hypothetical protein
VIANIIDLRQDRQHVFCPHPGCPQALMRITQGCICNFYRSHPTANPSPSKNYHFIAQKLYVLLYETETPFSMKQD